MLLTMGVKKAGRPSGSAAATKKGKLSFTIDQDLLDYANKMPNRSAFINEALRAYIKKNR